MFKRVVWMGMGFGAGVGATVWVEVKLRQTAQRLTPGAIGDQVAGRVRSLGVDVRDALRDGRQAMVAREAELRAEHGARVRPSVALMQPDAQVIDLPTADSRRRARTQDRRLSPAVRWADHGHERPSARLS